MNATFSHVRPRKHLEPHEIALFLAHMEKRARRCRRKPAFPGNFRSERAATDWLMAQMLFQLGLRRAELCAVTLGDLDPTEKALYVRRGKGSRTLRHGTKLPHKPRWVDVNTDLTEQLRVFIATYRSHAPNGALLFASRGDNSDFSAHTEQKQTQIVKSRCRILNHKLATWRAEMQKAHLGEGRWDILRPHACRHSFATLKLRALAKLGAGAVASEYLKKQLGHSTDAMMAVYVETVAVDRHDFANVKMI